MSYLRSPQNIQVIKFALWEIRDCSSADGTQWGEKCFENIFIEVVVAGMTQSKRKWRENTETKERAMAPACWVY